MKKIQKQCYGFCKNCKKWKIIDKISQLCTRCQEKVKLVDKLGKKWQLLYKILSEKYDKKK